MAVNKDKFRPDPATGFGAKGTEDRFYHKDGSVNVLRRGVHFLDKLSWYHTMLSMPQLRFYTVLWVVYLIVNLFFALSINSSAV